MRTTRHGENEEFDGVRGDPVPTIDNLIRWERIKLRDAALKAHETQIDPDSHWFAVPHDLEAEIWGTDDYELARSLVDAPLPEDDLFAGVRERVTQ